MATSKKKTTKKKVAKPAEPAKAAKTRLPAKKAAPAKAKAPVKERKATARASAPETAEAALKRTLLQKRDDILRETRQEIQKYIKGENRQLVETALDEGDWSVVDLAEDVNFRKLMTNRETLEKINESIRKIGENTYGTCEDCGEKINPERLKVLPFAIRCRDCQENREELEAAQREEQGFF